MKRHLSLAAMNGAQTPTGEMHDTDRLLVDRREVLMALAALSLGSVMTPRRVRAQETTQAGQAIEAAIQEADLLLKAATASSHEEASLVLAQLMASSTRLMLHRVSLHLSSTRLSLPGLSMQLDHFGQLQMRRYQKAGFRRNCFTRSGAPVKYSL